MLRPTPGKSSISNGPSTAISCNTPMAQQDVKEWDIKPRTVQGESWIDGSGLRGIYVSVEEIHGINLSGNPFRDDWAARPGSRSPGIPFPQRSRHHQVPAFPVIDEGASLPGRIARK